MIYALVVTVMFSFSLYQTSYSQVFESDGMELYIPEKMIVGETYQGMVTILTPQSNDSLIIITNDDNHTLETVPTVMVRANQNHGIFDITPLNEGTGIIFASFDGELISSVTQIYSEKSGPKKLKIILPGTSTIANELTGFVFLLDGNASPVLADRDIHVSLLSTEKIIVPPKITILNGTTNASFKMDVSATGDISTVAQGLETGFNTIQKSQQTIDVKMAIAPNIIKENSSTNYFVWLQKDGKPYSVPSSLKVEIQSSDIDVIRMEKPIPKYKNDNTITTSINDGLLTGTLYTGSKEVAEVFVSIQGYGHASSVITVGPATLLDGEIIDEQYLLELGDVKPNHIQFWVYPDVTDDVAYGVAALYHSETEDILDVTLDDDGVQVTSIIKHTTLIPIYSEDEMIGI